MVPGSTLRRQGRTSRIVVISGPVILAAGYVPGQSRLSAGAADPASGLGSRPWRPRAATGLWGGPQRRSRPARGRSAAGGHRPRDIVLDLAFPVRRPAPHRHRSGPGHDRHDPRRRIRRRCRTSAVTGAQRGSRPLKRGGPPCSAGHHLRVHRRPEQRAGSVGTGCAITIDFRQARRRARGQRRGRFQHRSKSAQQSRRLLSSMSGLRPRYRSADFTRYLPGGARRRSPTCHDPIVLSIEPLRNSGRFRVHIRCG
jgi:hypothetical protein